MRRFGEKPNDEWHGAITSLSDYQLQRGMRRALNSGKSAAPSLPEFLSWCRAVGSTDGMPDDPEALRPHALALPNPGAVDEFDVWDMAANRHLLAHFLRAAMERRYLVMGLRDLLDAKEAWAEDMRDLAQNGAVPVETQRQIWDSYVGAADKIAQWKQAA